MIGLFVTIVLGAVGSILAAEMLGWCAVWADRLVNSAVNRLPESFRARYRDEWLADMDMLRRGAGLSLLLWAVVVYSNAGKLACVLMPGDASRAGRLHRPTFAEIVRATKQAISELPGRSQRLDYWLSHRATKSFILIGMVWSAWISTRFNPKFCTLIFKLVKRAERSDARSWVGRKSIEDR